MKRWLDYTTYILLFILLGIMCFVQIRGIIVLNILCSVCAYYNKIPIITSTVLIVVTCYTVYETILLDFEKRRSKEDEKNYSSYLSYNDSSSIR